MQLLAAAKSCCLAFVVADLVVNVFYKDFEDFSLIFVKLLKILTFRSGTYNFSEYQLYITSVGGPLCFF